ncbi:MAG: UPF0182 protein [Nitrospinaceae bacterium]|nr:MAG: UPF0182 protein [Nitrospinaceae bacterium]
MDKIKKWLFILTGAVVVGSLFADKILVFYIDWLWFESLGFQSVLWTTVGSQMGLGLLVGGLFFAVTCLFLRHTFKKTSHLPVLLSDQVKRDLPFLDLMATNLKPLIILGPLVIASMTGLVMSQKWDILLMFFNGVSFGGSDPVFGKDFSFYLFVLPFWVLFKSVLWEALVVIAIGVGLIYFFKRFIYLGPSGVVVLPEARRTLLLLAGFFFLLLAVDFYFQRYGLLTKGNGVVTGIGFSDDYGRLPLLTAMSVVAVLGAVLSFLSIIKGGFKKVVMTAGGLTILFFAGNIYPTILQKFIVTPNELIKEAPYIEHTIAGSLAGYGLDQTETHALKGSTSLTAELIEANAATIENIRLWDQEPLLDTLGQIQEIRTYYQFNSVDNDRYMINGNYRQTLLSPRELLSSSLPNRTWINEHLTFTHGYGVSLSPVNHVTPEGLPVLFIKDIPPRSEVDLEITRPEIYFGELSNDHVFVNTGTKEFDYPEGEKNVYKNYEGKGGFAIGSFIRKALLAARFKTMKILFSEDIENESRVLMYRNITERVQKVAPFLKLDKDPYLVISNGGLFWIYDAYTVSDRFPYSQMIAIPQKANYIRNSVKIVIDAYEGSMNFYISDPKDPVILTYQRIFPNLFQDLKEMNEDLKSHIRYPSDLFAIQTALYATYHMKTPQVFYNKEDQWEIPKIDGKFMLPYYTIMKLPSKEKEEYILMLPFTPQGKSNLSAWMVARSDGEDYGKLVVYTFPKQKLVYGPSQIVARINQEAEISRQVSLWDQRGSSVIQGTLLVIPVEEALLYVRPLYLKADAGKIPELKRVIVGYEDNIAMEPTLDQALQKIFGGLMGKEPREGMVDERRDLPEGQRSSDGENVVLRQSDYMKIKSIFDRVMQSQQDLDKTLADYKKDLRSLGEVLGEAEAKESEKTVSPEQVGTSSK